jgi:hemerythrin-like metal-binding protein
MPTLTWSDALSLQQPQMDTTHQEFVDLLAAAEAALDAEPAVLLQAFQALLEHTVEHFAQEDRWMAATGFSVENCHTFQHAAVLQVMRNVVALAQVEGDFGPLKQAVAELAQWFPTHASSMDAGLAFHMSQVGFDPVTGQCREAVAEGALTGCGSTSCYD